MSQHFHRMQVGDTIDVKGPVGHFEYKGKGVVSLHGQEQTIKRIGLLAGGTGITPTYQVLMAIAKDPEDTTEAHLIFANKSPADVFLREELEALAAKRSNIHVWFTVDSAPEDAGWPYSTGFLNAEMIEEKIFGPGEACLVGMCGPPRCTSLLSSLPCRSSASKRRNTSSSSVLQISQPLVVGNRPLDRSSSVFYKS